MKSDLNLVFSVVLFPVLQNVVRTATLMSDWLISTRTTMNASYLYHKHNIRLLLLKKLKEELEERNTRTPCTSPLSNQEYFEKFYKDLWSSQKILAAIDKLDTELVNF